MKITVVAGTRPNFIKIAPILRELKVHKGIFKVRVVHTGQHYDNKMSDTFFDQLGIQLPDTNLNCGGGTQAEQTAAIMIKFEKELSNNPADLVLVVGDVTSTMACTIVSKKLNIKVAHVEAGLRSNDLTMPEEINRLVTDSISDYFFTTSRSATDNLINSGIPKDKIFFVGNVMIDTLRQNMKKLYMPPFYKKNKLKKRQYIVMTLHRPSNVDSKKNLQSIIEEIIRNSNGRTIVFPVHPRTRQILSTINYSFPNLLVVEPMGYLEFIFLVKNSLGVITDSGGITEETTVLKIPCITLRNSTERPETVTVGTNLIIGDNPKLIGNYLEKLFEGKWKKGKIPEKWDGKASTRIVGHLLRIRNRDI